MILITTLALLGFHFVCNIPKDTWMEFTEQDKSLLVEAVLEKEMYDHKCEEVDYLLVEAEDCIKVFIRCKKWRI